LSDDLAVRLADRFTIFREQEAFVFPGVGDNLEWEVEAPQRLGIYAIWIDVHGDGLPEGSTIKPDRIIRSLTELVPPEQG
jgi:FMN phosphatase YigB (HAD superfamily)